MSAYTTQKEKFTLMLESMGIPFEEKEVCTTNYLSRKVKTIIVIRAVDNNRARIVGGDDMVTEWGFDKDGNFHKGYIGN